MDAVFFCKAYLAPSLIFEKMVWRGKVQKLTDCEALVCYESESKQMLKKLGLALEQCIDTMLAGAVGGVVIGAGATGAGAMGAGTVGGAGEAATGVGTVGEGKGADELAE